MMKTYLYTDNCDLSQSGSQRLDLNFRAINYSADLYINGHYKALPKGMFRRHSIDVTDFVRPDGPNLLAILVHPPDHPGKIPPENYQGGDHEVHVYFHTISLCFLTICSSSLLNVHEVGLMAVIF